MKIAATRPVLYGVSGIAGLLLAAMPTLSSAGNGLALTGFGSTSAAMGGVDLVISRDVTALNANPAGMAQLSTQAMDIYLEPTYTLDNAHVDQYNRKQDIDNRVAVIFGGGYARPLKDGELVAGIAVFSQGGIGYVYEHLNTAYGTRDEVSAIFGIFKLTPGIAWRVNEQLRIGAALGINYASARQKFFYDTSVFVPPPAEEPEEPAGPEDQSFFGSRLDGLYGFGFNGKFGLQYLPTPRITLALTYTSKIPLDLDHGRTRLNFESIGLDRVEYRKASLHGLSLPQELGVGASYRLNERWLVAAEFNWMDYSTVKALTLKASDPSNSEAAPELSSRQALDFRDVFTYGLGLEHQWSPKTRLQAGFHHANVAVPSENLSPVLPLIFKDVLAAGISTDWSPRWIVSAGLEYQLPTKISYNNEVLPFGADAAEFNQALLLTLMLSQRW